MDDALEEVHEELLVWAENEGVEIGSIRPMRLSGRGFGIIATEHIPEDTEVLTVPVSALRTKDTVPSHLTKALPKDLTVHGLLAADLALNHPANFREYAAWNAVVPTWRDIQLSMPLTWPPALQARLPTAAKRLLAKQRNKFDRDWSLVSGAFPLAAIKGRGKGEVVVDASCTRAQYLYAWLLVNTRTFYFVTPRTEKLPKEDHMVLQPVADLFNHTDAGGCHVTFDHAEGFSFRTAPAGGARYEKGDEVHISYGPHSNDFLLVEYGFVLHPRNAWDEACLDDAVVPSLSRRQREALDEVGFLGNYVLDRDTVCHRTQVAARLFLTNSGGNNEGGRASGHQQHQQHQHRGGGGGLSMEDWRRFVSGLDDGEKSQRRVDGVIVALLRDYLGVVAKERKEVEGIRFEDIVEGEGDEDEDEDDDEEEEEEAVAGMENNNNKKKNKKKEQMHESRRALLLRRWDQIEALVSDTIRRLK